MFGKKPAPPPPPAKPQPQAQTTPPPAVRPAGWAMQALTADYLASGFLAPIEMPLAGFLNVPTQTTLVLIQGTVQSAAVPGPGQSVPELTLPKVNLIALIPQDDPGRRSAAQQMPNRPERAVLCAGPYLIRAALMLPGDTPLRNFFGTGSGAFVAVTQAEITRPAAGLPPLSAPILLLNKNLVQLYHPA